MIRTAEINGVSFTEAGVRGKKVTHRDETVTFLGDGEIVGSMTFAGPGARDRAERAAQQWREGTADWVRRMRHATTPTTR